MSLKISFITALIVAGVLSTSCGKTVHNHVAPAPSGGQDSGGGDPLGSREFVIEALFRDEESLLRDADFFIRWVLMEASSSEKNANTIFSEKEKVFFKKFYKELINRKIGVEKNPGEDLYKYQEHIWKRNGRIYSYSNKNKNNISARGAGEEEMVRLSSFLGFYNFHIDLGIMYYDQSKNKISATIPFEYKIYSSNAVTLNLMKNQPCKDVHNNPKAGSVKEIGGSNFEICLSMKQLKNVAETSLKEQITGLILHELAHLAGFYEEEAQKLQKMFLDVEKRRLRSANFTYHVDSIEKYITAMINFTGHIKKNIQNRDETNVCDPLPLEDIVGETSDSSQAKMYSEVPHFIESYIYYLYLEGETLTEKEQSTYTSLIAMRKISEELNSIQEMLLLLSPETEEICKKIQNDDLKLIKLRLSFINEWLQNIKSEL